MFSLSLFSFLIGFYSYFLVGNINMAAVELAQKKKAFSLWAFLILVVVCESVYAIITLSFSEKLHADPSRELLIKIISISLLSVLGLWCFLDTFKQTERVIKNRIRRGIFATLFHPQQIPFWLICGEFIHTLGWNPKQAIHIIIPFTLAGVLTILMLYAKFGDLIVKKLSLNAHSVSKIIGLVCLALAISESWRLINS